MRRRGRFITLEGIDGAGKSTHIPYLAELIAARNHVVVATREPGGTDFGEALRQVLLHQGMTADSEALLMFAARREHLEHVVRPALARGDWVLCDRFTDATFAYQGGGHGVPFERIVQLEAWIQGDCRADRTILFDVPTEVSRERLTRSHHTGRGADKFERQDSAFFERVRNTYLDRARAEPQRFRIVDATRSIDDVRAELARCVDELERIA